MNRCLNCQSELKKVVSKRGVYWTCSNCNSVMASIGFLRKNIPEFVVNHIWQKVRENITPGLRDCPSCGKKMFRIEAKTQHSTDELDVCKTCQLVWFDEGEYEVYPLKPTEKGLYDGLSEEDRDKMIEAQLMIEREILEVKKLQDSEESSVYGFLLHMIFSFFRIR